MNKHTPGPWAYTLTGRICTRVTYDTADDIATVKEGSFGEFKANVHLIAAAPDLLAALERIVEHPGEFAELEDGETMVFRMTSIARAAISKARAGE
jgi:hypothetical protein